MGFALSSGRYNVMICTQDGMLVLCEHILEEGAAWISVSDPEEDFNAGPLGSPKKELSFRVVFELHGKITPSPAWSQQQKDSYRWGIAPSTNGNTVLRRLGFYWTSEPTGFYYFRRLQAPIWFIFLLSAIVASLLWLDVILKRHRRNVGLCPTCSYDLRSHAPGDKCPECGTPVMGNTTFRPRGRLENETPNHTH